MSRIFLHLVTCVILMAFAPFSQAAASRVALVIGNSAYTNISSLRNPVNDALLMARTLEASGFTVTTILDADQKTMKRAMLGFTRTLRKTSASGLFYYAGHGVQVGGENYLIPLGVDLQDQSEIEIEAINVNAFVRTMENTQNPINIVILDACRNNPFPGSTRSTSRGLADVRAPRGTYMAYSTAPGQVSDDGNESDGNSPYTLALARAMAQPGLTIEQVFKQTRVDVLDATDEAQVPWENSSITGEFYFRDGKPSRLVGVEDDRGDVGSSNKKPEFASWDVVKNSNDVAILERFIQQFPGGTFAVVARARIRKLKPPQVASLSVGSGARVRAKSADRSVSLRACDLAAADPFNRDNPAYARGVKQADFDKKSAITLCSGAVLNNPDSPRAKFQLARAYHFSAKYGEAHRLLEGLASKADYAVAQTLLGTLYRFGYGVTEDWAKARMWYQQAAENNSPEGQFKLGLAYARGESVTKNHQLAFHWIEQAARFGVPYAQLHLGAMFRDGRGTAKDLRKAFEWYEKAAEQGIVGGQLRLADAYRNGRGTARNYEKAAYWYKKTTIFGSRSGKYQLGLLYFNGKGVPKNLLKASSLIHQSATSGYLAGQYFNGVMHQEGWGTKKNAVVAAYWFHKSLTGKLDWAINRKSWETSTLKELQKLLKNDGHYSSKIDGRIGPGTRAAMKALCNCG